MKLLFNSDNHGMLEMSFWLPRNSRGVAVFIFIHLFEYDLINRNSWQNAKALLDRCASMPVWYNLKHSLLTFAHQTLILNVLDYSHLNHHYTRILFLTCFRNIRLYFQRITQWSLKRAFSIINYAHIRLYPFKHDVENEHVGICS